MLSFLLSYLIFGVCFGTFIHIRFTGLPLLMLPISVLLWPIPLYTYIRIVTGANK